MLEENNIYLGDSQRLLQKIRQNSVDTVITDPIWPDNNLFKENPIRTFDRVINNLPRGVKRLAIVLNCDSDPRFLKVCPKKYEFFRVFYLRYILPGHKGRLLNTGNIAYLFGTPPKSVPGKKLIPGEKNCSYRR